MLGKSTKGCKPHGCCLIIYSQCNYVCDCCLLTVYITQMICNYMHMTHVASINLATQNASPPWAPMTSPSRGRSPRAWKCPMWCASSQTPGATRAGARWNSWPFLGPGRRGSMNFRGNVGDVSSKFEALSQPEWWYIYIYINIDMVIFTNHWRWDFW